MNWLDSLTEFSGDVIPKDFFTVEQIAEKRGMSPRRVRALLAPGVKSGKIIVRDYRIQNGRHIRPIPHYGPAKCKRS